MLTIMTISVCFMSLLILSGLAILIYAVSQRVEKIEYILLVILASFLISYIAIDFTFGMLSEIYNLPSFSWEWN